MLQTKVASLIEPSIIKSKVTQLRYKVHQAHSLQKCSQRELIFECLHLLDDQDISYFIPSPHSSVLETNILSR